MDARTDFFRAMVYVAHDYYNNSRGQFEIDEVNDQAIVKFFEKYKATLEDDSTDKFAVTVREAKALYQLSSMVVNMYQLMPNKSPEIQEFIKYPQIIVEHFQLYQPGHQSNN